MQWVPSRCCSSTRTLRTLRRPIQHRTGSTTCPRECQPQCWIRLRSCAGRRRMVRIFRNAPRVCRAVFIADSRCSRNQPSFHNIQKLGCKALTQDNETMNSKSSKLFRPIPKRFSFWTGAHFDRSFSSFCIFPRRRLINPLSSFSSRSCNICFVFHRPDPGVKSPFRKKLRLERDNNIKSSRFASSHAFVNGPRVYHVIIPLDTTLTRHSDQSLLYHPLGHTLRPRSASRHASLFLDGISVREFAKKRKPVSHFPPTWDDGTSIRG